ncbi:MAG: GNAT family N-acetyltransferase [Clostridia bacterium]|nr:GNAT family N-acetyltransferase [Clostridia bacterium]
MLRRLKTEEFDSVFSLMEASFPIDERRPYAEQRALLDDSAYEIYVIEQEGKITAFMAVWQWARIAFIEHFAVEPACRNGGIGGKMLQELLAHLQTTVCLEVEPPVDELTHRRIGFYRRHGFFLNDYPYVQPAISAGKTPVPLMLMSYGSSLSLKEFAEIKRLLYKKVYKVKE